MNELTSLGLILLLALLAGHLVRFARVPEVTGYILAGIALGPSVLGWVSQENLHALEILSEVALGLILFSVGTVFEMNRFARIGRRVLLLTLIESVLAAGLVAGAMLALGQSLAIAALLGAIAIATAPASTLMVIRETDSQGPLTDNLLGIIAVNNIYCIIAFSVVAAGIDLSTALQQSEAFLGDLYKASFFLVWQLVGSVALGYLVGLTLALWSAKVTETGEMLILTSGSILLCVGTARVFELSPLVASMAVGATMVNISSRSLGLVEALQGTDPPFYAIFFVLAGADLDLSLVSSIGVLGVAYIAARALGKFAGARFGASWLGLDPNVSRYLGFALMAQAGLAVGLTLSVEARFAEIAPQITTVVLAAVAIHEVIGPISARFALVRAGETPTQPVGGPGSLLALE